MGPIASWAQLGRLLRPPFQLACHSKLPSIRHGFPFGIAIHSKWLAIRNGCGITPKGPMGPSPPKGAEGALGSPWPFGPPLGPSGGWGGGGVPGVPLGPRDRHLVEARKGRLEREVAERIPPERIYWVGGMRVSVYGFYDLCLYIGPKRPLRVDCVLKFMIFAQI